MENFNCESLKVESNDLTHLLESEESDDEDSSEHSIDESNDLTCLLDSEESDREDISDSNDLTHLLESEDSYDEDTSKDAAKLGIPTDKLSYILYPPKIISDVGSPCHCSEECYQKLNKINDMVTKIQAVRLSFFTLKQGYMRTSKLIELVKNSRVLREKSKVCQHSFEGVLFCIKKWTEILHISSATYYRLVNLIESGVVVKEKIPKLSSRNCRGLQVCGFIKLMLDTYAEYSPVNDKRIFPPVITRTFLWKEYEEHEEKKSDGKKVTQHHFFKIFKSSFDKEVSFAKQKYINPCTVCLVAGKSLETLKDPEEKNC